MKRWMRTTITIFLLILFVQFTSACTVIGYYIGNAADEANTEIKYNEISTLEPYTEINITFKSGGTKYGIFKNAANDTLNLHGGRPVLMGNIKELNLVYAPDKYQYIGMAIGAVIDIALIINMVMGFDTKIGGTSH